MRFAYEKTALAPRTRGLATQDRAREKLATDLAASSGGRALCKLLESVRENFFVKKPFAGSVSRLRRIRFTKPGAPFAFPLVC